MRVTRALWASLGAGTSIVLMGVGVLAAVSTLVAFNGWPGASGGGQTTPQAMLAQSAPAVERISTTPKIVVPEARPRPARRETSRARIPVETARGVPAVRVEPLRTGTGPILQRERDTADSPVTTPPVPEPTPGDPVRQAGTDLGKSTDQTVKDLGKAVEPLSPTLGKAVGDVGQVVGDTVQGVTDTVSDVLDAVIKPTP